MTVKSLHPIRLFLFFISLLPWASGCGPSRTSDDHPSAKVVQTQKPNIILIVADDHGSTDLGCYGNKAINTPNLDGLAKEGVRFTRAHCTTASCSASRSVILSGIYNHANGHYGHQHDFHHFSAFDNIKSLPVYLKEKGGYVTARIGKYHVAPESVYKFDQALKGSARNAEQMADNSLPFLQENKDKPFFLYFCTDDPHRSGSVDSTNQYLPNRFGNKPNNQNKDAYSILPSDVIVPDYLPDNAATRAELVEYYKSVNRMDKGIGKLFSHLKNEGLWDNTIIIYISDNGIAFPGAKTTLYNPGMRLPCIVRNPFLKRKKETSEAMINWADLTPTLLDFVGLLGDTTDTNKIKPDQFHGRSFKTVLDSGQDEGWDEIYASHTFHEVTMYYPMRVVISGNYKLIWNLANGLPYPFASDLYESATWQYIVKNKVPNYGKRSVESYLHRPPFELYDLGKDPHESINLVNSLAHRETFNTLAAKIKTFQEKTKDPWIVKWQYE